MLTVCLKPKSETHWQVHFFVNKEQAEIYQIRSPKFMGSVLTAQIGGFIIPNKKDKQQKHQHIYCFLGPCRLFDQCYTKKDIETLYSAGTRKPLPSLLPPMPPPSDGYIRSFRDVFIHENFVQVILPFFSFMNVAPPFFIEKIVDLFRYFDGSKYYQLIAEFLMRGHPSCLSYSLYLRFFTVFTENWSEELFLHILLNFEIWYSCAEPTHVKRIAHHWNQVLFPSFTQQFLDFTSFREILAQTQMFFWFSKDDVDLICPKRSPDLPIDSIRVSLNSLLAKFASLQLTPLDVQQCLSLLSLLCDISGQLTEESDCVRALHPLFTTEHRVIFSVALQTVFHLCTRDQVAREVELISAHISRITFHAEILDKILEISRDLPEVISLATLVAVNCYHRQRSKTVDCFCELVAAGHGNWIIKLRYWYVWPFILVFHIDSRIQELLVQAICEVMLIDQSVIDQIFGFLDLLGVQCQVDVYGVHLQMLDYICGYRDRSLNEINLVVFRCARYLLFQFCQRLHSDSFWTEFENSPFAGRIRRECYATEVAITDVYQLMEIAAVEPLSLIFRINVSDGYLPRLRKIIAYIATEEQVEQLTDQTASTFLDFFKYLKSKPQITQREQFDAILQLSQSIGSFVKIMNISFGRYWVSFCSDLEQYLKENGVQAETLVHRGALSLEYLKAAQSARLSHYVRSETAFNQLQHIIVNSSSIWKEYASDPPSLIRSSRLLDDFSSPTLENHFTQVPMEIEPLQIRDRVLYRGTANVIQLSAVKNLQVLVLPSKIILGSRTECIELPNSHLRLILFRGPYMCEFVTQTGTTYLIEFSSEKGSTVNEIFKHLKYEPKIIMSTSNLSKFIQNRTITNDWVNGLSTNFDYIMQLNYLGLHSFNSISKYPVFPFLQASAGDLRDFTVPLQIRPQIWLTLFSYFPTTVTKARFMSGKAEIAPDDGDPSSFSKDLDVLEILENRNLELTPEFFMMPEAFANVSDGYSLVYRMRRLLESEKVSKSLNHWFDLVFGPEKRFRSPHPVWNPIVRDQQTAIVAFDVAHGGLSHISIGEISPDQVSVFSIVNDSEIRKVVFEFATGPSPEVVFSQEISIGRSTVVSISNGLLLIDAENSELEFISPTERFSTQQKILPTEVSGPNGVCFATHGPVFCLERSAGRFECFGVCKVSPQFPVCVD
jgi:hypothetical protein